MAQSDEIPTVDMAEEAELHFTLGRQAYAARRLDDALAHLLTSHRLAPNRNTAYNVALAYEALDRPDQAWRYYDVSVQGERDLELVAAARTAMARLEPLITRVEVTSQPSGATVYVQRRDLGRRGTTPLSLALMPGAHTLLLELEGYTQATLDQTFTANAQFNVRAQLQRDLADATDATLHLSWVQSTVRVGDLVVLQATPEACAVLPDLAPGLGVWREPAARISGLPPGSVLAAGAPLDASLDVAIEDQRIRTVRRLPLTREGSRGFYTQSTQLHAWILDRCDVLDGGTVAAILADLKGSQRRDVVAILGELAIGPDATDAATRCAKKGDCGALGELLR